MLQNLKSPSQRATLNQRERTYTHITEMDLKGAQRDLVGDPIPKPEANMIKLKKFLTHIKVLLILNRSWKWMVKNPNLDNEFRHLS